MNSSQSMLGIIAGGGKLPLQLVESCQSVKRPFFVLALEESADIEAIRHIPHTIVRLGAVGEALTQLKKAGVKEIVLAGKVRRPALTSLRPDMTGAKLLARLGGAFFAGDDGLLKAVVSFLEEEGFTVVGANDILAGLVAPEGLLGKTAPSAQAMADITHGMKILKTLGALDIGQAVIIENGYVLGVEAAEGTDALIERCGTLRREKNSGVLVKCKKPGQEERVDLPTVGPATIDKIHSAGFAGIAVESGGSLIVDRDVTVARADRLGIFVIGVHNE